MKYFAILPALVASAVAIPALQKKDVEKKDVVWVTEYDVKVTTVDVWTTIFVTAGAEPTSDGPQLQNKHAVQNQNNDNGFAVTFSIPTTAASAAPVAAPSPAAQKGASIAPAPVPDTPTPAPAPITTTAAPAPAPPATSQYVPPSAPAAVATTAPAPAPAPASSSAGNCDSTNPGAECTGAYFSYYEVGMGACGITSVDTDYVFAISAAVFDAHLTNGNPNDDALCGRKITITSHSGSPITATLVDRCVGCADMTHLDLSPSLWNAVSAGDPSANGLCKGYTWEWQ